MTWMNVFQHFSPVGEWTRLRFYPLLRPPPNLLLKKKLIVLLIHYDGVWWHLTTFLKVDEERGLSHYSILWGEGIFTDQEKKSFQSLLRWGIEQRTGPLCRSHPQMDMRGGKVRHRRVPSYLLIITNGVLTSPPSPWNHESDFRVEPTV